MPWIFPPETRRERVSNWFAHKIKRVIEIPQDIKAFFFKIGRVFDYLPVIWNDFDFNSEPGIYVLLRKKLERLEPCVRYGHLCNGRKYANEIVIALKLLDRIIDDKYQSKAHEAHEAKWGDPDVWFEPIKEEDTDCYEMKSSNYPNAKTPEEEEQAGEELIRLVQEADNTRQRDIEFLFKFLSKRAYRWWD